MSVKLTIFSLTYDFFSVAFYISELLYDRSMRNILVVAGNIIKFEG